MCYFTRKTTVGAGSIPPASTPSFFKFSHLPTWTQGNLGSSGVL